MNRSNFNEQEKKILEKWTAHVHGNEPHEISALRLQIEEMMLRVANAYVEKGTDEKTARRAAANLMTSAVLSMQYEVSPESQKEMVFWLSTQGPWDELRVKLREGAKARKTLKTMNYLFLGLTFSFLLGFLLF